MNIVVRITRHPLDVDREQFLKNVFGNDVRVVTEDIRYGDDPMAAVRELISRVEAGGGKVAAIEAQAPMPITIALVNNRRDLGVKIIRADFDRDAGGRAIVCGKDASGRDLLKFSHYEELERIEFQTRRLEPQK